MTGRTFVDTNVWVYAVDGDEPVADPEAGVTGGGGDGEDPVIDGEEEARVRAADVDGERAQHADDQCGRDQDHDDVARVASSHHGVQG